MNLYKQHEIYKNLYFHELDVKEKITNRVQLTFAFHMTILTILAYMLRNVDYNSPEIATVSFYTFISITTIFIIISLFHTVNAFWGNTYKALVSAQELEDYRLKTIKHEKDLSKYKEENPEANVGEEFSAEEKLNKYIYDEYAKCASCNSKLNDLRAFRNHEAIKYILIASIPFLLASACFIAFNMDASSPRKGLLVEYKGLQKELNPLQEGLLNNYLQSLEIIESQRMANNNLVIEKQVKLAVHKLKLEIMENIMAEQEKETPVPTSNEIPPPPPVAPEQPHTREIVESEPLDINLNEGNLK